MGSDGFPINGLLEFFSTHQDMLKAIQQALSGLVGFRSGSRSRFCILDSANGYRYNMLKLQLIVVCF
jgi:hypothetical protein